MTRMQKYRRLHEWLELVNTYATPRERKLADREARRGKYTPKHAKETE